MSTLVGVRFKEWCNRWHIHCRYVELVDGGVRGVETSVVRSGRAREVGDMSSQSDRSRFGEIMY